MAANATTVKDLSKCQRVARELASDIVCYMTGVKTTVLTSSKLRYAKTMRRVADELLEKHSILFNGMVQKLNLSEVNAQATIDNIANQMLVDGQFNWGRLVTLYAFSGLLAKHCLAEHGSQQLAERIATYTGSYVADHLTDFIHTNGGWTAFEEYFPEPQAVEKTIWRGLLYTVVGLGAIATMVSAR